MSDQHITRITESAFKNHCRKRNPEAAFGSPYVTECDWFAANDRREHVGAVLRDNFDDSFGLIVMGPDLETKEFQAIACATDIQTEDDARLALFGLLARLATSVH